MVIKKYDHHKNSWAKTNEGIKCFVKLIFKIIVFPPSPSKDVQK